MTDEFGHPWTDVTFVGVYWNDPDRVYKLLQYVRPWFTHMVVGVQTDDPTHDLTLDRARRWADETVVDRVAGHCEPTIGKVLYRVKTGWSFLVSADEWPTEPLLMSFQDMLNEAANSRLDGFWIRMLSSIEGVAYPSEQDNHLRVFRTALGWPTTLHSRPNAGRSEHWRPDAMLLHDRSLDEMMQDYLRYFEIGRGNKGWEDHNRLMMHDACEATAKHYGWDRVTQYDWWPEVLAIAFEGNDPSQKGVSS